MLPKSAIVLALTASLATAACAQGAAPRSGLFGTVTRGPTMPVCMVGVPCEEPAARVALRFTRRGSREGIWVRTDAEGRFRIRLAPGIYRIRTDSTPVGIGKGLHPPAARVLRGRFTRLDLSIDTGIR